MPESARGAALLRRTQSGGEDAGNGNIGKDRTTRLAQGPSFPLPGPRRPGGGMSTSPPTDPARWRRIEAILDLALELPPEELNALLEQACAGDLGLRKEVEAVLAADAQAGAFLGVPAGEYAPDLLAEDEEEVENLAGHQMGPYRLRREIGGGGMGTV